MRFAHQRSWCFSHWCSVWIVMLSGHEKEKHAIKPLEVFECSVQTVKFFLFKETIYCCCILSQTFKESVADWWNVWWVSVRRQMTSFICLAAATGSLMDILSNVFNQNTDWSCDSWSWSTSNNLWKTVFVQINNKRCLLSFRVVFFSPFLPQMLFHLPIWLSVFVVFDVFICHFWSICGLFPAAFFFLNLISMDNFVKNAI